MSLPVSVRKAVEAALEKRFDAPRSIRTTRSVGGGCINPSARLEVDGGEAFFLKWNDAADAEMFGAEADGLRALAAPGALRVPAVLGVGGSGSRDDPGWLLLEFVSRGSPGPAYGRKMGHGLARLHASPGRQPEPPGGSEEGEERTAPRGSGAGGDADAEGHREPGAFGWHRDNFIGSLDQSNRAVASWPRFWRDVRLEPQLRLARDQGFFRGREGDVLEKLLSSVEGILPDDAGFGPSLLHGDLWSGNYYPDDAGEPVLIDPAVYRGDGEVDLAMMELFGSLPSGFREGYEAVRPISPEYPAYKRDLYQLYYLLVHVNLFGGGYVGGSLGAARRVLAAI